VQPFRLEAEFEALCISPVAKPKSKLRVKIVLGHLSRIAVWAPLPALITSITMISAEAARAVAVVSSSSAPCPA
jgi:hypothetical protein